MTFQTMKTVVLPEVGMDVRTVIKKALELSLQRNEVVEFILNGILITVDARKIVSIILQEEYNGRRNLEGSSKGKR